MSNPGRIGSGRETAIAANAELVRLLNNLGISIIPRDTISEELLPDPQSIRLGYLVNINLDPTADQTDTRDLIAIRKFFVENFINGETIFQQVFNKRINTAQIVVSALDRIFINSIPLDVFNVRRKEIDPEKFLTYLRSRNPSDLNLELLRVSDIAHLFNTQFESFDEFKAYLDELKQSGSLKFEFFLFFQVEDKFTSDEIIARTDTIRNVNAGEYVKRPTRVGLKDLQSKGMAAYLQPQISASVGRIFQIQDPSLLVKELARPGEQIDYNRITRDVISLVEYIKSLHMNLRAHARMSQFTLVFNRDIPISEGSRFQLAYNGKLHKLNERFKIVQRDQLVDSTYDITNFTRDIISDIAGVSNVINTIVNSSFLRFETSHKMALVAAILDYTKAIDPFLRSNGILPLQQRGTDASVFTALDSFIGMAGLGEI